MPENDDILGPQVGINANSAADLLAARLAAVSQESESASGAASGSQISSGDALDAALAQPPASSMPSAADLMQAEQQAALSASKRVASRRSPWDAEAANAKAAGRPFAVSEPLQDRSFFDAFAYDEALQAQRLQQAGDSAPAGGWDGPAWTEQEEANRAKFTDNSNESDPWASVRNRGRVDTGFALRGEEYSDDLDSLRQTYTGNTWADARQSWADSKNEPLRDKVDTFADTAARFGVDTGVLGERVRSIGSRALSNMKEDFNDPSGYGKLNYGYALQKLGQEGGQYYEETNSGKYLTPEQQETVGAGLLPAVGAITGTAIGSMIAPGVGSWVGGMIGGGVGSGIQGVVGANEERAQSVRETGSLFGMETGASASALKEFTDALSNASAATKEVQTAFTTLSNAGPGMGAATLPGTEFMSGALGERYNPALSGLSHAFSSDPIMRGLNPQITRTGGRMPAGQLGDIATAEAFSGDWQASNDAATLAEGALTDPQYAADMNRHNSLFSAGGAARFLTIGALFHPVQNTQDMIAQARLWTGQDDKDVPGADAAKAQIAKDRTDAYKLYVEGSSAEETAKTSIGLTSSRLSIAEDQGASDSQLAGIAQGVYSAVGAGVPKLQQEASGIDAYLASHTKIDPTTRMSLQKTHDTALTDAAGMEQEQAQTQKALFGRTLATEESGFSLSAAQSVYSGQSAASRRRSFQKQADFLSGVADAPGPLSPAERNQLRESVLTQQHDFQETEFGENAAQFGLTQATNQEAITRGLYSGKSYRELQGEEDRSLLADRARAAGLRTEAGSAGVPYAERLQKLGQAAEIETGAAQQQYGFKMAGYAQNLAGDDLHMAQAGLGVTQAKISGGPEDVYQAQGAELEAYKSKIAELSSELSRGGMTVDDRIAKERQLTDTRQQSAQATFARDQAVMNDTFNLDSTLESNAEVGLGRRIMRGGNAGAGDRALSFSLTDITDAQNHLDFNRQHDGKNLKLIADDEGRLARTQESREQLLDRTNEYHPGGAFTRKLMNDKTDFQITMEAPFMDGNPENNPLTRGNAVLGDLRRDVSGLDKNRADLMKAGRWRDEDETHYAEQKNSDRSEIAGIEANRRIEFANLLPLMIAGSPGQGNLAGILPTPGQSAYYNGNPFISGTFGPPNPGAIHDGSGHTAQAGGAAGAFLAGSGAANQMSAGAQIAALTAEIKRLNDNVQRGSIGGRSAAMPGPSGFTQNSNLVLNAGRADGRY